MSPTYFYQVYGISIEVDRPIPNLIPLFDLSFSPDLHIFLEQPPPNPRGEWRPHPHLINRLHDKTETIPWLTLWTDDQERLIQLRYWDNTSFIFDMELETVWAVVPPQLSLEYVSDYLLNQALSLYLRLCGQTCLHGSSVQVGTKDNARAILFIGESGAGKSTTASYFAQRGHRALTDDVCVLTSSTDGVAVQFGYPYLRLMPDATAALFGSATALPKLAPDWHKRIVNVDDNNHVFETDHRPLKIGAVYIIVERAQKTKIEPLNKQQALMMLMDNAFLYYLLDQTMRTNDFDLLASLVAQSPVRNITTTENLSQLPDLYDAVLADLRSLGIA